MQTQAIDRNLRIAVLAGGSSSEREVSLKSGENARDALRAAGFKKVDLLDPADKMFIDSIRAYDLAFLANMELVAKMGRSSTFLTIWVSPTRRQTRFQAHAARTKTSQNSSMPMRAFLSQRALP